MLFNSIEFLIFLPTVFLVYWFARPCAVRGGTLHHKAVSGSCSCSGAEEQSSEGTTKIIQNAVIIISGYIFYGWINPKLCLLIAFITTVTFLGGLLLGSKASIPGIGGGAQRIVIQ